MFNFIHRLQRKSEREQQQIAFATALVITLIIFVFWLSFFLRNILGEKRVPDQIPSLAASSTVELEASLGPSPFSTISNAFEGLLNAFSGGLGGVKYESTAQ